MCGINRFRGIHSPGNAWTVVYGVTTFVTPLHLRRTREPLFHSTRISSFRRKQGPTRAERARRAPWKTAGRFSSTKSQALVLRNLSLNLGAISLMARTKCLVLPRHGHLPAARSIPRRSVRTQIALESIFEGKPYEHSRYTFSCTP